MTSTSKIWRYATLTHIFRWLSAYTLENIGEATRRMTSLDPAELLLVRRDKPHAGHPVVEVVVAIDYASLSRSLPPQLYTVHRLHRHLHYLSSWSIADVPADTARSGPAQLSINRVPKPLSFPEQSCTLLCRRSAGTYEDPRNEYNKGRRRIDKRSTAATSHNSPGTGTPPRACIVLKRFPGPRARGITLGKRVVMVDCNSRNSSVLSLSFSVSPSHLLSRTRVYVSVCVCVCIYIYKHT